MKTMAKACLALAMLSTPLGAAQAATTVEFWHAMSGELADRVNELVDKFNKSQNDYAVRAVAKGTYDEVVNSMIAAYRAKQQPAIVQVNERGFLTMVNSGATLPVAELMAKEGYKINWGDFIAPIATYYTKDGAMMSMPFNASTPILFYNKDHFKAAGFDAPADTWKGLEEQLYAIKKKGVSKCAAVLPADWEWSYLENYSAIEDQPYATKRNGFDGYGAEYVFNKTKLVGHIEQVKKHLDDGLMELAGQGINPGQLFIAGQCSTVINSTAAHAAVEAGAKFQWSATFLPHEEGSTAKNSTIGGAALWTLKGKTEPEYKAVAAFYDYLGKTETQVWWHKATGYVPVTSAAYAAAKAEGYYKDKPTREIAVLQLMRGTPSDNSRGFRLGNSAQANIAIKEEIMAGLLGQKPVQKAMDMAVERGNQVLRQFEKVNAGKN
ncbi:ABC transporter substrate-binding protein [Alsobacter metallidurans]|uniref:sn-glycerol-3-phosphate-binding periplasmic protein UgpB n=1 Tax=Alsobacter metallidurans TaxID=340221 RepID=A0A917I5Y6_9HYPH|nr:extracellular solute-binding protein [Alsobacter metallidurans]GGH16330.1 ABC transporter substrate-binding protein [Alsobacter metallidurans]